MLTSSLPLDGRDEPEKECADIKSGATSSGGFGIGFFVTAEEAEKAREAALALMAYDPQALPPPAPPFKRHQVTNNPYGKYCSEPDAYIPLRKLAFCCQGSDDGIAVLFWEVPPASPDEGEGEGEGKGQGEGEGRVL